MSYREYSFPCGRRRYCKIVGDLLPNILGRIFSRFGFRVTLNNGIHNGVDILVFDNSISDNIGLVLVGEILNWSPKSRLANKRKNQIVDKLCEFDRYNCKKVLFHSIPMSNIDEVFEDRGIDLICMDYQILPIEFYIFFLRRDCVAMRRPLSPKHILNIEQKVWIYLRTNNLL